MLLFPVIIHLLCFSVIGPKKARAAVTFKFLYFDNAEGDFATRGWLSSSSLFVDFLEAFKIPINALFMVKHSLVNGDGVSYFHEAACLNGLVISSLIEIPH